MADNTGKNIGAQGLPVLNVGNPGNKGGTGRPTSEIRAKCRGSFDERIKVAEQIADAKESTDSDKLRALDLLGKYGLPAQQEQSGPDGGPIDATITVSWVEPPKPEEGE